MATQPAGDAARNARPAGCSVRAIGPRCQARCQPLLDTVATPWRGGHATPRGPCVSTDTHCHLARCHACHDTCSSPSGAAARAPLLGRSSEPPLAPGVTAGEAPPWARYKYTPFLPVWACVAHPRGACAARPSAESDSALSTEGALRPHPSSRGMQARRALGAWSNADICARQGCMCPPSVGDVRPAQGGAPMWALDKYTPAPFLPSVCTTAWRRLPRPALCCRGRLGAPSARSRPDGKPFLSISHMSFRDSVSLGCLSAGTHRAGCAG